MKGLFITFEGMDGSGKTTQAKMLCDWMRNRKLPFLLTKEPGSLAIKECVKIRNILLHPDNDIVPITELFLFLADRAQHVEKLIRPQLELGKYVICDRFLDSTRVYQSARGISRSMIDTMINFATNNLFPDITFVFDLPVEIGLERVKKNGADRIEQESFEFHEKIRYGFLKLAESIQEEHRFQIIDASKTPEEIHSEIVNHLSKKIWIGD